MISIKKLSILLCVIFLSCNNQVIENEDLLPEDENEETEELPQPSGLTYPIVSTNQKIAYNNSTAFDQLPGEESEFYGQDAHYKGLQPSYSVDEANKTVTDNHTGLMWEQGFNVMTSTEAEAYLIEKNNGIYSDWRIPTIKELYSLIQFDGTDVSGSDMESQPPSTAIPFIDDSVFDFEYFANGTRSIDVQYYSSTEYTGVTMGKDRTLFGLNVADGRIKGYPFTSRGAEKEYSLKLVRGNTSYGINQFVDNEDETISDIATGLMWDKEDSQKAMEWAEALTWVKSLNASNYKGYNDWRLPNAKELHSILDYSRSPQSTNSAAIDPIFSISKIEVEGGLMDYPFFWSSTTHLNLQRASNAVYLCFGEALGFFPEGSTTPIDVHGAGAQRSSPKTDDGKDYSQGHGPQGDVVRFENYVRVVRTF
ncbi:DUF1566 domain-containing protein [Flammeovirga yaeyamensis]|uniref:DUF1566 domain-containing protein n=1 Tax=Flammeovirga yaeyamensis TaxID=367791 RepID=A0AAX1N6J4_9BACT|nr:DUF1566 domain-containing protein [Flammeovirga yaeyamensis]MBB3697643.1 hypothetical protein [Flammeovirga yaeyamensis]NMF35997.1 DUF1566 domain-containing protein [Flammeovirga yaeyamensis]QWG03057.1 DUF1566 domain-containing protein [Flammeovirga yaeyamensis]